MAAGNHAFADEKSEQLTKYDENSILELEMRFINSEAAARRVVHLQHSAIGEWHIANMPLDVVRYVNPTAYLADWKELHEEGDNDER